MTWTILAALALLTLQDVLSTPATPAEHAQTPLRAAALYPRAQAPILALSQLAHRLGDRAAARTALGPVLAASRVRTEDEDPWWTYRHTSGRRAKELRHAMDHSLLAGGER